MNRLRLTIAVLALTAAAAGSARAAGDYTLYTPKTTDSATPPASPEEGLLVRSIVIQKGDTLWKLASRYRGKGSYYPQFLLLNTITNPDLIYAGKTIQVPVTPDRPAEPQRPAAKRPAPRPPVKAAEQPRPVPAAPRQREIPAAPKPAPAPLRTESREDAEQQLFEAASRAYKSGDCRAALEQFDRFLNRFPASPVAADISLYKADCYMKLSGQ